MAYLEEIAWRLTNQKAVDALSSQNKHLSLAHFKLLPSSEILIPRLKGASVEERAHVASVSDSPQALTKLVKDPSKTVRRVLARNLHLSVKNIEELWNRAVKDTDDETIRNLFANELFVSNVFTLLDNTGSREKSELRAFEIGSLLCKARGEEAFDYLLEDRQKSERVLGDESAVKIVLANLESSKLTDVLLLEIIKEIPSWRFFDSEIEARLASRLGFLTVDTFHGALNAITSCAHAYMKLVAAEEASIEVGEIYALLKAKDERYHLETLIRVYLRVLEETQQEVPSSIADALVGTYTFSHSLRRLNLTKEVVKKATQATISLQDAHYQLLNVDDHVELINANRHLSHTYSQYLRKNPDVFETVLFHREITPSGVELVLDAGGMQIEENPLWAREILDLILEDTSSVETLPGVLEEHVTDEDYFSLKAANLIVTSNLPGLVRSEKLSFKVKKELISFKPEVLGTWMLHNYANIDSKGQLEVLMEGPRSEEKTELLASLLSVKTPLNFPREVGVSEPVWFEEALKIARVKLGDLQPIVLGFLLERLENLFSDNDSYWQTFFSLSKTWEGTLMELVDSIKALN